MLQPSRRPARLVAKPDTVPVEQGSTGERLSAACALPNRFQVPRTPQYFAKINNTAIVTAFNVPWRFVGKVLPHVNVVLHDHKLADSDRHRKWTGVPNQRILETMKRAYETFSDKTFIPRTLLIPGVNDDEEHIRAVLAFIRPCKNVIDYELLPHMRFGESKYGFLGRIYEMQDFNPPTHETLQRLWAIIDEAFGRKASAPHA